MINVLVTGANGQLAKTIALLQKDVSNANLVFKSKKELDITKKEAVVSVFNSYNFDFCVNCAAYTNVEQAEKTPELSYEINGAGVKSLAEVCLEYNTTLIHISTDYVFDGTKKQPYSEVDSTNPLNEYGKSKLEGEYHIQNMLQSFYIIRTSWLYSAYEKNFFNTICNYLDDNKALNITTEQIGTPTSCVSLARYVLWMISSELEYGIYHFSDDGETTWYGFAQEIAKQYNLKDKEVLVIPSESYPTISQRPVYSVLDNRKRKRAYKTNIDWKTALKNVYQLREKWTQ